MRRIVVIGGCNLDIRARSSGSIQERTSNPGRVTFAAGGVARNIAEVLARLGCAVSLISSIGRDETAATVLAATAEAGVDVSLVQRNAEATGVYCAIVDRNGELAIAVSDMAAIDMLGPAALEPHAMALEAAPFIVADCNLPQATLAWLMRYRERLFVELVSVAKSARLKAVLDPARPVFAATPNRDEARALTGLREPLAAARALRQMGVRNVMLNLGAEGAVVVTENGQEARVQSLTLPRAIASDVTGAGDATVAGLLCGLMQGLPFLASSRLGQAGAALRLMALPMTRQSLEAMVRESGS